MQLPGSTNLSLRRLRAMKQKTFSEYDSDWEVCLLPYASEAFLEATEKQKAAVNLAFMLFHLKQLVTTRQNETAVALLNDGLDHLFLCTDVFHLSKERFLAFLTGELR